MGISSTKKFLKNLLGIVTEEYALTTSAGAADANAIPALNAAGVLDQSIVNAKVVSAGAGDSGKLPALDATGHLDQSVMPVGIGADTASVLASEALADGDLVNVWNNAGVAAARKADGSTTGKEAHGFVQAAVASGAAAVVYFEGINGHVVGLTPGRQWLSATTPGKSAAASPTGSGQTSQIVGFATSATSFTMQSEPAISLA